MNPWVKRTSDRRKVMSNNNQTPTEQSASLPKVSPNMNSLKIVGDEFRLTADLAI